MWPAVMKWTIPCPEARMSAYTYVLAKPFISVVGNEIFCGRLFPSQDKIGNNISQLAGKPLRLSLKDKTAYKLLLKCNLKTNSEKPLLTLWQSPSRVLSFPLTLFPRPIPLHQLPLFLHFPPFLTDCFFQSVSRSVVPLKRWSTFESVASLKSSHLFSF